MRHLAEPEPVALSCGAIEAVRLVSLTIDLRRGAAALKRYSVPNLLFVRGS